MNSLTHILVPFAILLAVSEMTLGVILVCCVVFGALVDLDLVVARVRGNRPRHRLRSWIQEPAGFVLIACPIALLAGALDPRFVPLVLVPYGSHILLDYLTTHDVAPFAPFSGRWVHIEGFRPIHRHVPSGPTELWVLFGAAIAVLVQM